MSRLIIIVGILLFGAYLNGYSQVEFDTMTTPVTVPDKIHSSDLGSGQPGDEKPSELRFWSSYETTNSLMILCFGFLIILLEVYLIRKNVIKEEGAIRFITLTLIIVAALFLISSGYSSTQIASAMGLLGTIAGYLLGKNSSDSK
jgi:hypothetical protein